MPSVCPADHELSAFAVGELDAAATDRLAAHLECCANCRQRLADLDDHSSDLLLSLRKKSHAIRPDDSAGSNSSDPFALRQDETLPTPAGNRGDFLAGSNFPVEGPGSSIGPYRLQQVLGEGGFGTVFLAEQTTPVRREVAIKVIKLGMDTRQVLARFQAERQALAMMDHPNIARVLDAGTSERGRPYFVMELAKGVTLTDYCDTHQLSPRKRLGLFTQVCDAVQHAHTKGVIHRDLKPSNILVTMRDVGPVPKVIDFGIAKAIGGKLTDLTLYTEMRQFIGTPEYMSPEQADGAAIDVDARADVYSLGVLLYELLTGATPFDRKLLRSKGLEQIGKIIRETDPPKPSTRVLALGEATEAIATRRASDPRKLPQTLRGELDWITMKCLEKDRTHRYETANALAMDVRRFLKDEPVRAGPPGAAYHLRKFILRHRASVALAVAMAAVLLPGLGLAIHGWLTASAERDNARLAEQRELQERKVSQKAVSDRNGSDLARRLEQVDAMMKATPANAVTMVEELRQATNDINDRAKLASVADVFRQRLNASAVGSLARSRAACALCLLGDPAVDEVVRSIECVSSAEGKLLISALLAAGKKDASKVVLALRERSDGEEDLRTRARYAIALMFLGDDTEAKKVLGPGPDPTPASAFIAEFSDWHGDLEQFPIILRRMPEDVRAALCLAVGKISVEDQTGPEHAVVIQSMLELYRQESPGGVHSAAEQAIRSWHVEPPALEPSPDAGERGWFVNRSGLTMVRIPAGFAVLGNAQEGAASFPVLFTRPMYVSAREVPYELFRRFADDPALPPNQRPFGWQGVRSRSRNAEAPVAVNMTIQEAALFCNWLSEREGRRPCYQATGPRPGEWRFDPDADGYHLPNAAEWEYVARAGAATRFACCDDATYLMDFASIAMNRNAGGQPNRWGLFDTVGGVWEMCWDVNLFAQAARGVSPPQPSNESQPVVDPVAITIGRGMIFRGGADDSGTFDLRVGFYHTAPITVRQTSIGLRVICTASSPGAPPAVAPPPDVSAMWLWAAGLRPNDPLLAARGSAYAVRAGQEQARHLRFAEAQASFSRAVALKPDDFVTWYYLAAIRLHLGDRAGYRAACNALLDLAVTKNVASVTERAAKVILLDQGLRPGELLAAASAQASKSLELDQSVNNIGWFRLDIGMAAYRAGQYTDAVNALTQARVELPSPAGRCLIDLFLAMALHRSGQSPEGKARLILALDAMRAQAPANSPDWGDGWIDWLGCRIVMPEAEATLAHPTPVSRPAGS